MFPILFADAGSKSLYKLKGSPIFLDLKTVKFLYYSKQIPLALLVTGGLVLVWIGLLVIVPNSNKNSIRRRKSVRSTTSMEWKYVSNHKRNTPIKSIVFWSVTCSWVDN